MISFIKDLRRPSVGAVWTMLSIDQLDGHAVCACGRFAFVSRFSSFDSNRQRCRALSGFESDMIGSEQRLVRLM